MGQLTKATTGYFLSWLRYKAQQVTEKAGNTPRAGNAHNAPEYRAHKSFTAGCNFTGYTVLTHTFANKH